MGKLSRDEALASIKASLMARDSRVVDVVRGPKDYAEIPWAKDLEDAGGLYLTALFRDPRVPLLGYAGLGLSSELLAYVGDTDPSFIMVLPGGDRIADTADQWIKAYCWYLIEPAVEAAVEAYLQRGYRRVEAPQFTTILGPEG